MVVDDWRIRGACTGRDPDLWHPAHGSVEERTAVRICRSECPVILECWAWAVRTGQRHGIWGGMTERELHRAVARRGLRIGGSDAG